MKNVADLTTGSFLEAGNEPGQWVCWDFRKMRVRLTHYTIKSCSLKSWVLEGSVGGDTWTAIDRQADSSDFQNGCKL
jgi:hypothetical protein